MKNRLTKYLNGDTNQLENREVFEWIKSSGENEKIFKSLRLLHDITTCRNDAATPSDIRHENQKRHITTFMRIAAAILLITTLFYFYRRQSYDNPPQTAATSPTQMQQISAPTGQYTRLALDDGTKVCLNSKSTLTFPLRFTGTERVVRLSGEGYFEVAHDPHRPFRVETQQYSINVLGTEFNVRAYEGAPFFETSLLKGSVMIRSEQTSENFYLEPDQRAVGNGGKLNITPFNKDELLWREGILFINDKTIHEILPVLEQYFDVKFVKDEDSARKHKKYTGKFRIQDGIEHILNILQIQNKFTHDNIKPNE